MIDRALAFERGMHAAAAAQVLEQPWGFAYLSPAIARAHVRNACWTVAGGAGLDATAIVAAADAAMDGLDHRYLVVDAITADRIAAGLTPPDWSSERHLYLGHRGDGALDVGTARETPLSTVLPAIDRYLETDPATLYGRDVRTRAHIIEHHRTFGSSRVVRERCFAVHDDIEGPVAWALLWEAGGVAQVEDVVCLAAHRGRGYGRAVVSAATVAALAAEPELLFIVADADDWPANLYRSLGYSDALGHVRTFTRLLA